MKIAGDGLIIIGENFNATRKIKITSPRVVQDDGRVGREFTPSSIVLKSARRTW